MMKYLKKENYKEILMFIVFLIIPFVLYHNLYIEDKAFFSADGIQYFSSKIFMIDVIKGGEFPFWNKYLENGVPLAMDLNGVFYPLNYLGLFMDTKLFIYSFYAIHLAIGATFTYKYIKEIGCMELTAVCTAIIYLFSIHIGGLRKGHIVLIVAIIYLPVILFYIERYLKTFEMKYLYISAIIMAIQLFSGVIQYVFYTDVVVFFYLVFKLVDNKIKIIDIIKTVSKWICIYIVMSLAQLMPTLQMLNEYSKVGTSTINFDYFSSYSIHFMKIVQMIFPEFFINDVHQAFGPTYSSEMDIEIFLGTVVFIVIVYGIINYRKIDKNIKFSIITMIITFIYSANAHIMLLSKIIYNMPILGGFRVPSRALFIFIFFGYVIFALSIDRILKNREYRKLVKFSLYSLINVVVVMLLTVSINPLSNLIDDINNISIWLYFKKVFMPTILIILLFVLSLITMDKYINNFKYKFHENKVIIILIILITLGETYGYYTQTNTSDLSDIKSNNSIVLDIKNNIGNNKVWTAFPHIDGGYKTLLSQNSNMGVRIPTINAYIAFNNPRLYKLMTDGNSAPFNSSGLFTGFTNANDIISYKNSVLSMLGVEYIMDPVGLLNSDIEVKEFLGDEEILFSSEIKEPNFISGNIKLFEKIIDIKSDKTYVVKFDSEVKESIPVCIDFYGGPDYDNAEQEINCLISPDKSNYELILKSGEIPKTIENTKIRIIFYNHDFQNINKFTVYEREFVDKKNVYSEYTLSNQNRVFKNNNVKDILYIPEEVVKIEDVDNLYKNSVKYKFDSISYVENYRNMNLKDLDANVEILEFNNNNIIANVNSDKPAFMNFSQNFYPGWRAYVNGKETNIYLVNGLIQGIEIPKGNNIVEFKMQSLSLIFGACISSIAFLLIVLYLIINKIKLKGGNLND